MLLIVIFLVAGVFIEESRESNPPSITDLPDIKASSGESVVFNFTEKFDSSIVGCTLGLDAGHLVAPDPVLVQIFWNLNVKVFIANDERMSFVGQRNKYVWFKFANLTTNDTNTYRVKCNFNVGSANATAKLNVHDKPHQPDTTTGTSSIPTAYTKDKPHQPDTTTGTSSTPTAYTKATSATTSRSTKPSFRGNIFNMEFLVIAAIIFFIYM